jgi:hypothetical protein
MTTPAIVTPAIMPGDAREPEELLEDVKLCNHEEESILKTLISL